jgi:methylthioribose-1-phosphate isomerase
VAILAKYYGIPFYVLGPYSTVDFNCKTGEDIVIELREGNEIKQKYFENPTALAETKCYNPAFDVTDNSLITAIITDKGIAKPPYDKSLKELLK